MIRAAARPDSPRPAGLLRRKGREIARNWDAYLFTAPFYLIFFVFTVLPVLISIVLSFTYYNILQPPRFIGMQNYFNLFLNDDTFLTALKNTLLIALITGPVGYIASFLFAWFINELNPKLRAVMIVVFYAPSISGNVYLVWSILFSGDAYGYINAFLMNLGILHEPVQWLTDPQTMLAVVILVMLWMSLGSGFLAFVAGLQTVDRSMYEAGCVEGIRNRWQELWYITLPSMKPQLLFGAVMSITSAFSAGDVTTALCGFPSTDYAAHTMLNHLNDYGNIRFEMGYACAIATLLFIMMIGCNQLIQRLLRRVGT
ncbi:MAG TPA: sugar ABC transporter permease [Firmicutes bacterium]|nr:sugar ABC transporter permease [Bacillota bacterium]